MKYLCLIYDEEDKMATMSEGEATRSWASTSPSPRTSRRAATTGRRGAQAGQHGDHRPGAERQDVDDRRPVRGDEGATRGLLPDRGRDLNDATAGRRAIPSARTGTVEVRPVEVFKLSESDDGRSIEALYRSDSRRVLATLIRLLGDFDLAEEALHEAFAAAVERWPRDGVPANPFAWLVSTGRFKAIDGIRRRARFDASLGELARRLEASVDPVLWDDDALEDDRLRLIFTCCHPALPPDAQIALTLREVCGLTTEEIAHAYLAAPRTVAQRIVRAKAKIRDAGIPYQVPARDELPRRLDSVLHVVYLVFNEGYSASSGASLTRLDLSAEAIRLGRLLAELLPEPEVMGLLALMLLQESRRSARTTDEGELVLLADQDRSLWNRALIAEGVALVERALPSRRFGPYSLQAAIAACTPRRRRQTRPTGRRSSGSTTFSSGRPSHLSWSSIGPQPWPCGMGPRPDLP